MSQSNINGTKLKGFAIPYPPLVEQTEIAATLAALESKIDTEEARVSALGELFRSLLRDLMTGRVRVHELGIVPPKSG